MVSTNALSISGVIVKVAERCNLNCRYCYMYNHVDQSYRRRPIFISSDIFVCLIQRIADHINSAQCDHFSVTLHGGEPMLVPLSMMEDWLGRLRETLGWNVQVGMQTNATLVTSQWVEVLMRYKVSVGVSLDGPPLLHDLRRVDHKGIGSYGASADGLRMLMAGGITPSVLCVVTPGEDGVAAYAHFLSLGVTRMDFLIPELAHPEWSRIYGPSRGQLVADYLMPIFDKWFAADNEEVSIRIFDSILRKLLGGCSHTQAIGGEAARYIVVETDGSIHANDCLKVCCQDLSHTGLNVQSTSLADLSGASPAAWRVIAGLEPPATQCQSCPEFSICGGGAIPSRYSPERGFDNPSVWCEDLKLLIRHIRKAIAPGG